MVMVYTFLIGFVLGILLSIESHKWDKGFDPNFSAWVAVKEGLMCGALGLVLGAMASY